LPGVLGLGAMVLSPAAGFTPLTSLVIALWFAAPGYFLRVFVVRSRRQSRQKEMQKALPDALDMLVVCVEAGLGLNQALVRVADEIDHVSTVLHEQLPMVNLEMRAGTPRDEALKNFAERTGVADIRSLVSMLV